MAKNVILSAAKDLKRKDKVPNNILITGGAGYIGSHAVKMLGELGHNIVVLDNLSKGFREAVLYGELVVGDTGDKSLVGRILKEHSIDSVMHFAAATVVPESVDNPLKYYNNNTKNTLNLIECCVVEGVKNFIFSSTAAVYGVPEKGDITEDTPTNPINPYGASKLLSEMMLRDVCVASSMKYMILRYFNVAGCDPEGKIGQSTQDATLLIKVCAEVAEGKRDHLKIFGADYQTPDGTGVRDYIHVVDLVSAHIKALDFLTEGGSSHILNCGYGEGVSVKEVIAVVNKELDLNINVKVAARRAGDPPILVANSDRLQTVLDWQPKFNNLEDIVKTTLDWERTRTY